mmetsp:Transcript_4540/g.14864  ORF Transcript_4540/g.14864 Transcript_4540/m.14864 type:complete len:303 (+) Transcript_4540:393-1301(+)
MNNDEWKSRVQRTTGWPWLELGLTHRPSAAILRRPPPPRCLAGGGAGHVGNGLPVAPLNNLLLLLHRGCLRVVCNACIPPTARLPRLFQLPPRLAPGARGRRRHAALEVPAVLECEHCHCEGILVPALASGRAVDRGPRVCLVHACKLPLHGRDLLRGYGPQNVVELRDVPFRHTDRKLVEWEILVEGLGDVIRDHHGDAPVEDGVDETHAESEPRGSEAKHRGGHVGIVVRIPLPRRGSYGEAWRVREETRHPLPHPVGVERLPVLVHDRVVHVLQCPGEEQERLALGGAVREEMVRSHVR